MHVLRYNHANLHHLHIMLHRVGFSKIYPRLPQQEFVAFRLDANRLFGDAFTVKKTGRRGIRASGIDDAVVLHKQSGLERALLTVRLYWNALAEGTFRVHPEDSKLVGLLIILD
jgi:hypothetical protein